MHRETALLLGQITEILDKILDKILDNNTGPLHLLIQDFKESSARMTNAQGETNMVDTVVGMATGVVAGTDGVVGAKPKESFPSFRTQHLNANCLEQKTEPHRELILIGTTTFL